MNRAVRHMHMRADMQRDRDHSINELVLRCEPEQLPLETWYNCNRLQLVDAIRTRRRTIQASSSLHCKCTELICICTS
jgi:hypothetical protein